MFQAGNVPKNGSTAKDLRAKTLRKSYNRIFVARCMEMQLSIKHTAQAVSTRIALHSATLRCALAVTVFCVWQLFARSSLASAKRKNQRK